MNCLKKCVLASSALFALLFSACGDDTPTNVPVVEEPDAVVNDQVTTAAFSATITAKFNGVSKVDLLLGKTGVLYCLKSDDADSKFKAWKDGNDAPGCYVFQDGKVVGEAFNGTITNLYPDTAYSYCVFVKNRDNTLREISETSTFRTTEIKVDYKNFKVESVRMFSADVKGSIKMSQADFNSCSWGFLISKTENGTIDGDSTRIIRGGAGKENQLLEYTVSYLFPSTDYWFRGFITYTTPDSLKHSLYGPEYHFTTVGTENWGVDLGLPSGLLWSKCEMGFQSMENSSEYRTVNPFRCYWGSLKVTSGEDSPYEYYNAVTDTYTDLGDNIAGTEYDMVHHVLGGKWRLPTKEDYDELIQYCTIGSPEQRYYDVERENVTIRYVSYVSSIEGPNYNRIYLSSYNELWTATKSPTTGNPYFVYMNSRLNSSNISEYYFSFYDDYKPNVWSFSMLAVWDPNM